MSASCGYRVNAPAVIHQIIDGEAVIINLARGLYYSLDTVGADVWRAVECGMSRAQIVSTVQQAYDGEGIETAVSALLAHMTAEELIVEERGAPSPESSPAPSLDGDHARGLRKAFEPPVLHKYSDLQDLLLLDPIHQVDETGWPETRASAPRSDDARRR